MLRLFRRPKTSPDRQGQHELTLDLIEQVAALRGQVRAVEAEWESIRQQIRKDYQRMEKAHDRLEAKRGEGKNGSPVSTDAGEPHAEPAVELHGFAKKLKEARG